MVNPVRDSYRGRVYAVEDQLARMMDRAGGSPASVEFLGSRLTLPVERRFGDVPSVQRYVDAVLAAPAVVDRWPGAPGVRVRRRRGVAAAHYEPPGVIALPTTASWALRELVVCHEVAHHLTLAEHGTRVDRHGPEFTDVMAELSSYTLGPEVGFVLRAGYAEAGVPTVGGSQERAGR